MDHSWFRKYYQVILTALPILELINLAKDSTAHVGQLGGWKLAMDGEGDAYYVDHESGPEETNLKDRDAEKSSADSDVLPNMYKNVKV